MVRAFELVDVVIAALAAAGVDEFDLDLDRCSVIGCMTYEPSYIHGDPELCRAALGVRFHTDHRADEHHPFISRRTLVAKHMKENA